MNGKYPSIKLLHFVNGEKQSDRIAIEYDGVYYDINPTIPYLTLKKYRTPEEFKFNSEGYKLQKIMSTTEFVKAFEEYEQMMRKSGKEM